MEDRLRKTERLIKIWLTLMSDPFHLTTRDLSARFSVTLKTIYRDMESLDLDLRVPIRKEKTKWGIDEGHFLPPIRLSVPEAMSVFLAARLMLGFSHRYDPYTDSTFLKLSAAVPRILRNAMQNTLDWMQKLPKDDRHIRILAALSDAWVNRHQVILNYLSLDSKRPDERVVDPYFIEPAAVAHSSYLIGHCHRSDSLRTFKIERIQSVEVLPTTYAVSADFDANAYLSPSWGIAVGQEVKIVKLRFAPELKRLMEETMWHPSQKLQVRTDGSLDMTLQVFDTPELRSWVLGWADKVEVLEPGELRQSVISSASGLVRLYAQSAGDPV